MVSTDDYTGTTSVTRTNNLNYRSNTNSTEPTCIPEQIDTRTYSTGVVISNWPDEELIKELRKIELKLMPKTGWFNPNKIPITYKPRPRIIKKRIRNSLPYKIRDYYFNN